MARARRSTSRPSGRRDVRGRRHARVDGRRRDLRHRRRNCGRGGRPLRPAEGEARDVAGHGAEGPLGGARDRGDRRRLHGGPGAGERGGRAAARRRVGLHDGGGVRVPLGGVRRGHLPGLPALTVLDDRAHGRAEGERDAEAVQLAPFPYTDGMPTKEEVVEALRQVEDPELGMDIVELGLMYDVEVEGPRVHVTYTLTSIGCPVGPMIQEQIQEFTSQVPGVEEVDAELTWDPPWSPERMSDDAKFILGFG